MNGWANYSTFLAALQLNQEPAVYAAIQALKTPVTGARLHALWYEHKLQFLPDDRVEGARLDHVCWGEIADDYNEGLQAERKFTQAD
jgi:hypothetical protein